MNIGVEESGHAVVAAEQGKDCCFDYLDAGDVAETVDVEVNSSEPVGEKKIEREAAFGTATFPEAEGLERTTANSSASPEIHDFDSRTPEAPESNLPEQRTSRTKQQLKSS